MNVGIAPPALDFNAPEGLKITPSLATKPASPELDNAPEGLKISPKFDFKLPSLANAAPVGLELPADMATTITPIENTSSVIQFKQASMVQPPASPMSTASDTRTAGGTVNSHSHYVEFLYSLDAHFAGGMILHVSQDQFKPLAWDSKFKPSGDKAEAFWTLNSPSAFRVAYRTQMPYLGHVVDTPINKDFFTVWGFTELPKNILIQPIKVEEKITHLILMLTDGTKKSHHLLSAGEKFAGDFLQIIRNLQAA